MIELLNLSSSRNTTALQILERAEQIADDVIVQAGGVDESKISSNSASCQKYDSRNALDWKPVRPLRPLTAYNIYFLLQRERLLSDDDEDLSVKFTRDEICRVIRDRYNNWAGIVSHDARTLTLKSKSSPAKMSFGDLAKTIAKLWKESDTERRALMVFYDKKEREDYKVSLDWQLDGAASSTSVQAAGIARPVPSESRDVCRNTSARDSEEKNGSNKYHFQENCFDPPVTLSPRRPIQQRELDDLEDFDEANHFKWQQPSWVISQQDKALKTPEFQNQPTYSQFLKWQVLQKQIQSRKMFYNQAKIKYYQHLWQVRKMRQSMNQLAMKRLQQDIWLNKHTDMNDAINMPYSNDYENNIDNSIPFNHVNDNGGNELSYDDADDEDYDINGEAYFVEHPISKDPERSFFFPTSNASVDRERNFNYSCTEPNGQFAHMPQSKIVSMASLAELNHVNSQVFDEFYEEEDDFGSYNVKMYLNNEEPSFSPGEKVLSLGKMF